jgi:hypothetical protein
MKRPPITKKFVVPMLLSSEIHTTRLGQGRSMHTNIDMGSTYEYHREGNYNPDRCSIIRHGRS